jgi:long-chain acyl-CoA synthetase
MQGGKDSASCKGSLGPPDPKVTGALGGKRRGANAEVQATAKQARAASASAAASAARKVKKEQSNEAAGGGGGAGEPAASAALAAGGGAGGLASGGAALNPRIERIFYCAGLNLLQGYGLTETCVVVSINRFDEDNRMFGTTGVVVENSQVKIADEDGEILVKGPSLMMGYYKNPEATAEVIDSEGWFHTGDVGVMIDSKFLKITDRKKELFKTSSGKYISPIAIENKLKESKYIEQCMVVGSGQKYASAIIIPSILNFKDYFSQHNIAWPPAEDICLNEEVKKVIAEHVKKVNATLAPYEQLKRHQLITAVWGIESGEITPKLSLKRKIIHQKHLAVINKIFGED